MTNFLSFKSTVNPFSVARWVFGRKLLVDSNNAPMGLQGVENGPDGIWGPVDLTSAQIAAPTSLMVADLYAQYRLNVAPYTRYRSDGTTLQMMPSTGDSPTFSGNITMAATAEVFFGAADALAAAGSTQATGLQLTSSINNVTTVAAGNVVNLPNSAPGLDVNVINSGTVAFTAMAAQGNTVDTINGIAGSIGVIIPPGGVANVLATKAGALFVSGTNPKLVNYATNTASAAATLSAASMTAGANLNVIDMTGSLSAGAALTLPTVASFLANLPYANINAGVVMRVNNHSAAANSWTVTANGSFVVNGTSTVAQNTWRDFNVYMVNGTSAVAQDIGGGNII